MSENVQPNVCKTCGQQNAPRSQFCSGCGQALTPRTPSVARTCPKCGAPIGQSKFCPECGYGATAKPQSSGNLNVILAVVITLLVCVVGILAFMLLSNDDSTGTYQYPPSTQTPATPTNKDPGKSNPTIEVEPETDFNEAPTTRPTEPTPPSLEVGDTYIFGAYDQDGVSGNGKEPIKWIVLEVENGKAMLISEYVLDSSTYHSTMKNVTWEKCELRQWLNNDFLNAAFNAQEQSRILTTTVTADPNPDYNTDPGKDTQDKVYLLSITEAYKYLPGIADTKCEPSKTAIKNGVNESLNGFCYWWLRTPGDEQDRAAIISHSRGDRAFETDGSKVGNMYSDHGVRPVIWIELEG